MNKTMKVMCWIRLLLACAFVLSCGHEALAQSIDTTVSPGGVEFTNVVGATTENFDNLGAENPNYTGPGDYSTLNTAVGTLTSNPNTASIAVVSADQYGGGSDSLGGDGGTGGYIAVGIEAGSAAAESATLTFSQPESYVGMWWSATDPGNILQLYSGTTLLSTLDESSVNALVSGNWTYRGNPNGTYAGYDYGEYFTYLNFYSLSGNDITSAVITEDPTLYNAGFEIDNISVANNYSNPGITGTQVSSVPEPAESTMLGLGFLFIVGLIWICAYRRQNIRVGILYKSHTE